MNQIPSVGRFVHFFPNGKDEQCAVNGCDVVPALVIQAWDDMPDQRLNLQVFTMNPSAHSVLRYSVPHKSHKDLFTQPISYWDWPEIKK
jgi:hypothetical protein